MKISIIGPVTPYRGGIALFTTLLAKKLSEVGHDVQVISFKKQYPSWLYPGESDKDNSPGREKVEAAFILSPLDPLSWRRTINAIIAFQPQMAVLPWWVTFWGPAFHYIITHLKRKGIPVTVLIHNTIPHEPRPWDRFLARLTLKDADSFIVMTEKEKGRLLALLPKLENIQIASHPIYQRNKKTRFSKTEARKRLGEPTDKHMILFFGFIRPYKGLGVLIEAFKIIVDQNMRANLWIVGEFWVDKNIYLSQVKKLGLKKLIHFHDTYVPDEEMAAFFEAADVFVAPYIDGTQSGALKTALGFGLPAVVSDVIRDEIVDKLPGRCLVVPAGNPVALADGIQKQLQVPVLSEEDVTVMISHSWEAMLAAVCQKTQQSKKTDNNFSNEVSTNS